MPTPTASQSDVKYTEQQILNRAFDPTYQAIVVENIESNPAGTEAYRKVTDLLAVKVTVSGSVTYVGEAVIGSAQSAAVWRCKKIDETTGTIITWADSNSNFDNVATDLTTLTYG